MSALDVAGILGNVATASLLAIGGIAALYLAGARTDVPRALPPLLAAIAGITLIFLAVDEAFDLHERVGTWLYDERGLETPGPINHVDDLFIMGYIAIAAIVGVLALPTLVRAPAFLAWMLVAGTMFAAAVALDALGTPGSWTDVPEEALEACAAALLAVVFVREVGRARARRASPATAQSATLAAR